MAISRVNQKVRLRQLAAMFSKDEVAHGISSQDIANREALLRSQGIQPFEEKKEFTQTEKVFTPAGSPREEFFKEKEIIIPGGKREKLTQEVRDQLLPSPFAVSKKTGKEFRKFKRGPKDPSAEASERQKEALLRMTGVSQTQTTQQEAFNEFEKAKKERAMQIVVALEGGKSDDPVVQAEVLRLKPEERAEALEILHRLASRKGKASPIELAFTAPSDVHFVLNRVKPRR
jgi:hypothetical protein